jgi:hypothetical protein
LHHVNVSVLASEAEALEFLEPLVDENQLGRGLGLVVFLETRLLPSSMSKVAERRIF